MAEFWVTRAKLITPRGIVDGALKVVDGRIAAIRRTAPPRAVGISLRGGYLAPGFIDLHVWGAPAVVAREVPARGTSAFLTTVGPQPPTRLVEAVTAARVPLPGDGAQCLGIHLEGPFVNAARAGALDRTSMRAPTVRELQILVRAGNTSLKLITMAPELPGAPEAIRWCARRGIRVSLGHSEADPAVARRAVKAGARAVTHVFNGMPRFSHRNPSLLDVALTETAVTTMVIADGIHVSPVALRMLVRVKGPRRIALVTDSVRFQSAGLQVRRGAYYTRRGVLAGSRLTMMEAVRNMVLLAGASLVDAVQMASAVPARLIGLQRSRGMLHVGMRADLVGFDRTFRVLTTIVGGETAFWR